jgi:hypothetical protein
MVLRLKEVNVNTFALQVFFIALLKVCTKYRLITVVFICVCVCVCVRARVCASERLCVRASVKKIKYSIPSSAIDMKLFF